jgi:hypothetical protein
MYRETVSVEIVSPFGRCTVQPVETDLRFRGAHCLPQATSSREWNIVGISRSGSDKAEACPDELVS